jgi:hypothetical protein
MSEKVLDKIIGGVCSRAEFLAIRNNALRIRKESVDEKLHAQAEKILSACNAYAPEPLSRHYNFMGFCPGADFSRREDERWKSEGVCDFAFYDSQSQMETFGEMLPGDWVILKKRQEIGRTMKLYGFGTVEARVSDKIGPISYKMNWNSQQQIIEVPLMGCNKTVNIRSLETVEKEMPNEFWDWLSAPFAK